MVSGSVDNGATFQYVKHKVSATRQLTAKAECSADLSNLFWLSVFDSYGS